MDDSSDLASCLASDLGSPTRCSSPAAAAAPEVAAGELQRPPAKRARTDSGDAPADARASGGTAGSSCMAPTLDCYPYTFSPLLLFSSQGYFDKGYSNYNAVAKFFDPVLRPRGINMLENVLYDRKNMLYDELFTYVHDRRMFVPCCIDAHCTAFQVVDNNSLLYYDPLSTNVMLVAGREAFTTFMGFSPAEV